MTIFVGEKTSTPVNWVTRIILTAIIISFVASGDIFAAAKLCTKLYDFNMNVVSIHCVAHPNPDAEEDETQVYGCVDPDAACNVTESDVVMGPVETGPVDVYDNPEATEEENSGSTTGSPAWDEALAEDEDKSDNGHDIWDDIVDVATHLVHGICYLACHTGQNDFLLLKQSDKDTFTNHEKYYIPKHSLHLTIGERKYVGKGVYLVKGEERLSLVRGKGEELKTYPPETDVLTDLVGKPTYLYLGIEREAINQKK